MHNFFKINQIYNFEKESMRKGKCYFFKKRFNYFLILGKD